MTQQAARIRPEVIPPSALSGSPPETADWLFVHATGFCKEMWLPVIEELTTDEAPIDAVLFDERGHGGHTPHPGPFDWHSLATDVLEVLDERVGAIRGVGHSSGGASIARAESLRPGTFSELVLIEPIIFPGPYERREIPLAAGAERRRAVFPTRDAAFRRFADGPFSAWDRRVLDLYLDHGFIRTAEGLQLRCDPQVEAEYYREGSNVDTWERLGSIGCRVKIIVGERSDSHQTPYVDLLASRFRDVEVTILPGLSHLAPMEDPQAVAKAIVG